MKECIDEFSYISVMVKGDKEEALISFLEGDHALKFAWTLSGGFSCLSREDPEEVKRNEERGVHLSVGSVLDDLVILSKMLEGMGAEGILADAVIFNEDSVGEDNGDGNFDAWTGPLVLPVVLSVGNYRTGGWDPAFGERDSRTRLKSEERPEDRKARIISEVLRRLEGRKAK